MQKPQATPVRHVVGDTEYVGANPTYRQHPVSGEWVKVERGVPWRKVVAE